MFNINKMEIKTYVVGLTDGWTKVFEDLDNMVKGDLGTEVKIHSVADTVYRRNISTSRSGEINSYEETIARVVVYERVPGPSRQF